MLDPYHKPMESVGECDHANDHIADIEAKLAAAEEQVEKLTAMLDIAAEDLADHESVWRNEDASPPFKFVEKDEILAELLARYDAAHVSSTDHVSQSGNFPDSGNIDAAHEAAG